MNFCSEFFWDITEINPKIKRKKATEGKGRKIDRKGEKERMKYIKKLTKIIGSKFHWSWWIDDFFHIGIILCNIQNVYVITTNDSIRILGFFPL